MTNTQNQQRSTNIYRVQKSNNYVVMNKTALEDARLSWKAKGLHSYMMAMPDDWKFYDKELETHARDGKDALKSAIKELKQHGYMKRERRKNEKGQFEWETLVFEVPCTENPLMEKPCMENPSMDEPLMEKPSTENPQLLSNKELNNKQLSINKLNNYSTNGSSNVFDFYQQNCGQLSPFISDQIGQWVDDLNEELVIEALKIALKQQKKWKYAEGILKSWYQNNIRTLQDVQASEVEFKEKGKGRKKRSLVTPEEVTKKPVGLFSAPKELTEDELKEFEDLPY